jgi:hypothetical protein
MLLCLPSKGWLLLSGLCFSSVRVFRSFLLMMRRVWGDGEDEDGLEAGPESEADRTGRRVNG